MSRTVVHEAIQASPIVKTEQIVMVLRSYISHLQRISSFIIDFLSDLTILEVTIKKIEAALFCICNKFVKGDDILNPSPFEFKKTVYWFQSVARHWNLSDVTILSAWIMSKCDYRPKSLKTDAARKPIFFFSYPRVH